MKRRAVPAGAALCFCEFSFSARQGSCSVASFPLFALLLPAPAAADTLEGIVGARARRNRDLSVRYRQGRRRQMARHLDQAGLVRQRRQPLPSRDGTAEAGPFDDRARYARRDRIELRRSPARRRARHLRLQADRRKRGRDDLRRHPSRPLHARAGQAGREPGPLGSRCNLFARSAARCAASGHCNAAGRVRRRSHRATSNCRPVLP